MLAKDLKGNRIAQMLNLRNCKKAIRKCPKDETVILIPHYSINVQSEYENGEELDWDFDDLQKYFNTSLLVTDYDDLVADPHGLFSM